MKLQNPPNKQQILTIGIAAALAFALLFHLVTFQVRVTEVVVVTTFGKPTRSIQDAGLYWKWPYPFQDYFPFDARIQGFSGKMEQTYTKDDKNVIVETFIGWRIQEPIKFLTRLGTYRNAQKSMEALVRNYTNSVLAMYSFSDLVSEKAKDIKIAEIESRVLRLLNEGDVQQKEEPSKAKIEGIRESLGIMVEIFCIKKIELPESTTKEVFARMREERNRIVQSYQSQGEGEAKKIKAQADAMKEKMLIEAMAEATLIRGQGDAQAAKHYKTFEQNKELAVWLRKLDSLQKLLAQNKKITLILDTKTPPFDLLQEKLSMPEKKENPPKEEESKETRKLEKSNVEKPQDPESKTPEPENKANKPESKTPEPENKANKTEIKTSEPENKPDKPEIKTSEPENKPDKPENSVPEKESAKAEENLPKTEENLPKAAKEEQNPSDTE
ncbi:MAG: protease modulator HflC [Candidatus Brocadiae bacterium]|nr:protease modulator HflC [Candidatus Brocadiia bacterium]